MRLINALKNSEDHFLLTACTEGQPCSVGIDDVTTNQLHFRSAFCDLIARGDVQSVVEQVDGH